MQSNCSLNFCAGIAHSGPEKHSLSPPNFVQTFIRVFMRETWKLVVLLCFPSLIDAGWLMHKKRWYMPPCKPSRYIYTPKYRHQPYTNWGVPEASSVSKAEASALLQTALSLHQVLSMLHACSLDRDPKTACIYAFVGSCCMRLILVFHALQSDCRLDQGQGLNSSAASTVYFSFLHAAGSEEYVLRTQVVDLWNLVVIKHRNRNTVKLTSTRSTS